MTHSKEKKVLYLFYIVVCVFVNIINYVNSYGYLKEGAYRVDNDYIGSCMYVNEVGDIIAKSDNRKSYLMPVVNISTNEIDYVCKYSFNTMEYEYYDLSGNIFMRRGNNDRIILATLENLLFADGSFYNLQLKKVYKKDYFVKTNNHQYEAYKFGNNIIVQDQEFHIYVLNKELDLVKTMVGYVNRDVNVDINGNVYDFELSIFDQKYIRVYDEKLEEYCYYDENFNIINKNTIDDKTETILDDKYIAKINKKKSYENYNYNIDIYDFNKKSIKSYVNLQSVNEINVGNKKYFAFSKRLTKAGLWCYAFITDDKFNKVRETCTRFYGNNTTNTWYRGFFNIDLNKNGIFILDKDYDDYKTSIIEYCDNNLNTIFTYELKKGEEIISATDDFFVTLYKHEKYNLYKVKEGIKMEDMLDIKLYENYIVYSSDIEYGIMDTDLNIIKIFKIQN